MSKLIRFSKRVIDALPPQPTDAKARESEYSDTEVSGLKLLINKQGRKFFYLRYRHAGRQRSMKLGNYGELDVAEARLLALKHRAQLSNGVDPQAVVTESGLTFRRFIDDHYLPHAYASKRSANSDDSKFKTHLFKVFGARLLGSITRQEIQRYHDELISRRAPATANRHLALLKRCFNLAILWGYMDSNPATGIRMHTENNQSQRFLSTDEAKRLWSALDNEQNPIAAKAIKLMLVTGVRREEALQAKWEDIDYDRQLWHLPMTKSGRQRFVMLSETALAVLKELPDPGGSHYLFPGSKPGKPLNNARKCFQRALKAAGLTHLRIHDLRHTFASLAINNGATLYEVQHLLGHASNTTTQRYAHLASDNLRKASARVGALVVPTV
ncbi:tyrosine-type recombinase/integrase [Pseudomonas fulva]|uniref:Tyrosine-type recombinase/integrase n=1 Tax=Pseudomonas fulva TaxID=47880 RepID=A0A7S9LHY5_9PSED|nr:site-specific integrase [Pseudomonas fulva]QPH44309.1 tyrosine-type recombinase/integrase [Pseudomonas fulva]QPH49384.1 tyrosine-type recombinase/integrase [Pseudomonas fulva]